MSAKLPLISFVLMASIVTAIHAEDPTPRDREKTSYACERGLDELNREKWDEAIVWFDAALKSHPKLVMAFLGKGAALQNKENFDETIVEFDSAIKLDPSLILA
jgi:tetratricopeptide (TPR) repeat protein